MKRPLLTRILAVVVLANAAAAPAADGDWPMWGLTPDRNNLSPARNPPTDWDVDTGRNIKWTGALGSQSYGNPVVAGGLVIVGTNNEAKRNPAFTDDAGVLMFFRESDGKYLWQHLRPKLPAGRVNDWPYQGICASPLVEGDYLWYATSRCEVIAMDISPLRDGKGEPKILWNLDMMKELGVFPHNMTSSSMLGFEELIFVITGNGVDDTHKNVPAPKAPSIIAVEKKTGKVVWSDNAPGPNIYHGTWASPALAIIKGRPAVIAPLGDSWVYCYDARTGKLIWKFDTNQKHTIYPSTRNELISTPVIVGDRMYIANGQDPEHGEGPGHFWCVDITGEGDVSLELPPDDLGPAAGELVVPAEQAKGRRGKPNPNSRVVWHYSAIDENKDGRIQIRERVNRSISNALVVDDLVYLPDFSGMFHCFDAKTGQRLWVYDMEAAMWGSPTYIDGKIYLGDEDGDLVIFEHGREPKVLATHNMGSAIYSSPVFANGVLYIMNRDTLFAIQEKR